MTISTIVAGVLAGYIGFHCGSPFGYAIAWISGHEPAELKDMLIWCFICTPLVFTTTAVWATLQYFKVNRWVRHVATAIVCLTVLGSASIIGISYVESARYAAGS